MKKEKSLKFLGSKWLMISFFAFGILLFGNVNANAQNIPWQERITTFEDLRDSFAPGTAKYDIVQDAIEYLLILEENSATDPNYLYSLGDQNGDQDPLRVDVLRRTSPSILANYSQAELDGFQTELSEINAGSGNVAITQKIEWILEANAY